MMPLRSLTCSLLLSSTLCSIAQHSEKSLNSLPEKPTVQDPLAAEEPTLLLENATDELKKQTLISNTLLFWNTARGESPNPPLIAQSGVSASDLANFQLNLPKKAIMRPKLLAALKTEPSASNMQLRTKARLKFLNFVSEYQKSLPAFGSYLPEILTAWGEARNLSGFTEKDLLFQQAKIAAVIHVLRNRVARHCRIKKLACDEKEKSEIKWKLATKRYQFSSFEPYDLNFLEIVTGSSQVTKINSIESLPNLDQRALNNLVTTLIKLDQNKILFELPLANANTRHYITPDLTPFASAGKKDYTRSLAKHKNRMILFIPTLKPLFFAVVPSWIKQDSLIDSPIIHVESSLSKAMTDQKIPPKDFIYFGGLQ